MDKVYHCELKYSRVITDKVPVGTETTNVFGITGFHVQLICFRVNLIRFVLVLIDANPLWLESVCEPGKTSENDAVI
jgi:hypothetical protein